MGSDFCRIAAIPEAFELAKPGAVHVITGHRDNNVNLRQQMQRIIRKAGVKPWPKLFHNLRATRETELAASHPIHVVCSWIGHAAAIAQKHYLQVTDADFARAAQPGAKSSAEAVQNPVQNLAARGSTGLQECQKTLEKCEEMRTLATCCDSLPGEGLPLVGLEPDFLDLSDTGMTWGPGWKNLIGRNLRRKPPMLAL